MPILVHCPCGWAARVHDQHAGKRSKCPKCQATLVVPRPADSLPDVDDVKLVEETPPVRAADKNPVSASAQRAPDRPEGPARSAQAVGQRAGPARPGMVKAAVEGDDDVVTDGVEVVELPRRSLSKAPERPAADEPIELELDEESPKGRKPRRPGADGREREPAVPRKRKRPLREPRDEPRRPLIAFSPGVISGFLLLVSGGVWLAIALSNDRFNPRALVTMVFGLIMLGRGFLGLEED